MSKSAYRLGMNMDRDDLSSVVKLAISKYRYTVKELIKLIHFKLTNNQLPILPLNLEAQMSSDSLSLYKQVVK